MAKMLDEIKLPIKEELIVFDKHFRESMQSKVPLLDKITFYIIQKKGKQLRPILVFLAAKICGEISKSTYTSASLVELLHTATLVHDDVVDEAEKRRGFFSIYALWKTKIAVIVGDYLFSKGLLIALENDEYDLLQILSKSVKEMIEGELLQLDKALKLDIKEEVYFDVIRQKTASLIAASCCAGAASVTKDEEMMEKMRSFGEHLGIAFQIKDDLFDYGDKDIGKPRGIDIKEKKMTLPLIHALNQSSWLEKRKIIFMIKRRNNNKKVVQQIINFVKEKGGLAYAEEQMMTYKNKALDILASFPESEAKKAMHLLVDYATSRDK